MMILSVAERIEIVSETEAKIDHNHHVSVYDSPPVKDKVYGDSPLISVLTAQIYHYIYLKKMASKTILKNDESIFSKLVASMATEYHTLPLEIWQAYDVQSTVVSAHRYGCWRSFQLGECLLSDPAGSDNTTNQAIRVQRFGITKAVQPGFIHVFSHRLQDNFFKRNLIRLYWHVTQNTATELIPKLTHILNRYGIPFTLKTVAQYSGYNRSDACVLYLGKRHILSVIKVLRNHIDSLLPLLLDETPLFTKRLAPGIGLAEDPGGGLSFGMHRSRLIALGTWQAYESGSESVATRADAIRAMFKRHNICCDHPYRSLRDCYNLDHLQLI